MGHRIPSRRAFLGGAVFGGALVALEACGSSGGATRHSSSATQPRTTSTAPSSSAPSSQGTPSSSASSAGAAANLSVDGTLVSGSFVSQKRGGIDTGWGIVYPPGTKPGDPLPVVIGLHGRAGGWYSVFHEMRVDHYVADAVKQGMQPFAVAAVTGGKNRYWHPRAGGDDPSAMVVDEFIPLLAEHGLKTKQVALYGWSMGGFGALYIASVLGRSRVACIAAEGPSIFESYADREPESFDSPADFAAHSIFARVPELTGIPIRMDLGARDRFAPSVEKLRGEITPTPEGEAVPGQGHLVSFWLEKLPDEVRFIGQHLSA